MAAERLAFVCFLCAACAASAPPAAKPASQPVAASELSRFLPLVDATVFAYDTSSGVSGQKGMLVLEIRRPRPDMAELAVAGRVRRVEIDATGIRHATGGYLLKSPLALHARFPGDFGMVEIIATDRSITVPAGSFKGCIETAEELSGAEFSKRTVTVYCPDVGIVSRPSIRA